MSPEEAQKGLETIAAIRAHPDFANVGEQARAHLDRKEQTYRSLVGIAKSLTAPAQSQTVPLTPERKAKVQRQIQETSLPEGPVGESVWKGAGTRAVNQAGAIAASAVQGIPGLATTLETGGDIAGRVLFAPFRPRSYRPGDPAYDLAAKTVGSEAKQEARSELPLQPGSFERVVQGGEYPTLARATGMVIPGAAAARLPVAVGNAALQASRPFIQQGFERAFLPASRTFAALAGRNPGLVRSVGAAGGTAGVLAAGEAVERRIPAVASELAARAPDVARGIAASKFSPGNGEQIPPIDVTGEIGMPAAFGLAGGVLPGVAQWASERPLATTYAADRARGLHQQEPLASLPKYQAGIEEAGKLGRGMVEESRAAGAARVSDTRAAGAERLATARMRAQEDYESQLPTRVAPIEEQRRITQAELERQRQAAREGISTAKEGARQTFEDQLPERLTPVRTSERRAKEDVQAARKELEGYATMERGQAAADIAPTVLRTLNDQVATARGNLNSVMTAKSQQLVPADNTLRAVRQVVSGLARSDTRGTSKPLANGEQVSTEVFTPEGQAIANIERNLGRYLKSGGTVEDWTNAIRWLDSQERGSPATARIYREVAQAVRHGVKVGENPDGTPMMMGGLANEDPEIGAAWAGYRDAMTKVERASAMMLGEEDLSKLALKSAHGKLDVPLPGDPFTAPAQTVAEEEALRRNLMRVGQTNESAAAKLPQRDELEQLGFAEPLRSMEGRTAEIERRRREGAAALADREDAIARETASRELEARRELRVQANAPIREAVGSARAQDRALGQVETEVERRLAEQTVQARQGLRRETRAPVMAEQSRVRRDVAQAREQAAEGVSEAKTGAESLLKSKRAQEAARLTAPLAVPIKLLRGAAWTLLGHPTHGAALASEAGVGMGEALATPLAGRVAYRLPSPELLRENVPGAMGVALLMRRKRGEDVAQGLVDQARSVYGQAGRLRAPLGDLAKFQWPR